MGFVLLQVIIIHSSLTYCSIVLVPKMAEAAPIPNAHTYIGGASLLPNIGGRYSVIIRSV